MADEDPAAIDALLITHEHQDHVQGVAVLARKLGVPVYFTQATHRAWMRWMMPHKRMTYAAWLAQRQQDLAQKRQLRQPMRTIRAPEDAPECDLPCSSRRNQEEIPAGCPGWNTSRPAPDSRSATLPLPPSPFPTMRPTR